MRRVALIAAIIGLLIGGLFTNRQMAHIQIPAEHLFNIAAFPITNTLLASWLSILLLMALSIAATTRMQLVPGGVQNLMEMVVETLQRLTEMVAGPKHARLFFAPMATIFLFLLVSNWMGLLPGFGTIGLWREEHGETLFVPLLRSAATDLNVPAALAIISVGLSQYFGIRALGSWRYIGKFIRVEPLWRARNARDLLFAPIDLFVGILETITEVAKLISFSFRLFGNIFAGELVLAVIFFLIPWVGALPFYGLELMVGIIQAFVFAGLSLAFWTVAVTSHGEAH